MTGCATSTSHIHAKHHKHHRSPSTTTLPLRERTNPEDSLLVQSFVVTTERTSVILGQPCPSGVQGKQATTVMFIRHSLECYRRYRSLGTHPRLTFQAQLLHNQEGVNAEKGGFRKISSRAFFGRTGRCYSSWYGIPRTLRHNLIIECFNRFECFTLLILYCTSSK